MNLVTQSEYAKMLGVSKAYISKLKKEGRLVFKKGLVDADASSSNIGAKKAYVPAIIPEVEEVYKNDDPNDLRLRAQKAQLALTQNKAKNEELKYEKDSEALIPKADAESEFFELGRVVRESIQGVPAKAAPEICAALGVKSDKRFEIQKILADFLRVALEDLSTMPIILQGEKHG